jgi:hypothetical protein
MAKKTRSKKYPATTPEQAKTAVIRYYQALQLEWTLELQAETTDWEHLIFLHYTIADLERRAPWLKKEVA